MLASNVSESLTQKYMSQPLPNCITVSNISNNSSILKPSDSVTISKGRKRQKRKHITEIRGALIHSNQF